MADSRREGQRDGVRKNERDGEILVEFKRTKYSCCKIDIKGERKGV